MEIFLSILLFIVGMGILIKGADLFVDGSSSVAKAMHIHPLIIGLTLVSIGTSAPEFSVSLTSAIEGLNDMSFGNIVGSNIFNILFVIGVSAIITPLTLSKNIKKYDIPILCFINLLIIIFTFWITPNQLSRFESIILFVLTFVYIAFLIIRNKKELKKTDNDVPQKKRKWWVNVLFIIIGLAGVILGGELVVQNASKIAINIGMSELLVGLTIVAIGTSLPELVTSIVAAKKGENDIAIGNAVGSCIFNILLILGLSSTIQPIKIDTSTFIDVLVMFVTGLLIFFFTIKKPKINRVHGIIMIGLYVGYVTFIVLRNIYQF